MYNTVHNMLLLHKVYIYENTYFCMYKITLEISTGNWLPVVPFREGKNLMAAK